MLPSQPYLKLVLLTYIAYKSKCNNMGKTSKSLGFIKLQSSELDTTDKTFYMVLVRFILEYRCIIWGPYSNLD